MGWIDAVAVSLWGCAGSRFGKVQIGHFHPVGLQDQVVGAHMSMQRMHVRPTGAAVKQGALHRESPWARSTLSQRQGGHGGEELRLCGFSGGCLGCGEHESYHARHECCVTKMSAAYTCGCGYAADAG
jgi:hypothetical protein